MTRAFVFLCFLSEDSMLADDEKNRILLSCLLSQHGLHPGTMRKNILSPWIYLGIFPQQ